MIASAHRSDIFSASLRDEPSRASAVLQIFVECVMTGLIFFAPLAFGATQPWAHEVLLVAIFTMGLCVPLRLLIDQKARLKWNWAYLPVLLFAGLVLLQIVPLPRGLLNLISPKTV